MSVQPEPKLYFPGQSIWLKMSLLLFVQLAGAHPISPIFDSPLREASSNQMVSTAIINNPPSMVSYSFPVHFQQSDDLRDFFIPDDLPILETQTSSSSWKVKRLGGNPLRKKPENEEIPTQSDNANSLKYRGTIADLEEALINLHHIPPPPPPPSSPPAAVKGD